MRCQWYLTVTQTCGKEAVKQVGSGYGAQWFCQEHLDIWCRKKPKPKLTAKP